VLFPGSLRRDKQRQEKHNKESVIRKNALTASLRYVRQDPT
jgi:hypothetical protein